MTSADPTPKPDKEKAPEGLPSSGAGGRWRRRATVTNWPASWPPDRPPNPPLAMADLDAYAYPYDALRT